jgi:hypothetical protein
MNRFIHTLMSSLCAVTLLACAPACTSTVTPDPVAASQASYDSGGQNSGVISKVTDAQGRAVGWVVTARARARYNALIEVYGATLWTPPIVADYGVTPYAQGQWLMTNEAMAKFIAMNRKAKMGSAK